MVGLAIFTPPNVSDTGVELLSRMRPIAVSKIISLTSISFFLIVRTQRTGNDEFELRERISSKSCCRRCEVLSPARQELRTLCAERLVWGDSSHLNPAMVKFCTDFARLSRPQHTHDDEAHVVRVRDKRLPAIKETTDYLMKIMTPQRERGYTITLTIPRISFRGETFFVWRDTRWRSDRRFRTLKKRFFFSLGQNPTSWSRRDVFKLS